MAPAFLQLASRKDKDGTLVPKKDLSDKADGADDGSAQQASPPESFITQASPAAPTRQDQRAHENENP